MFRYSWATDVVEESQTELDLLKFFELNIGDDEGVRNVGRMPVNVS